MLNKFRGKLDIKVDDGKEIDQKVVTERLNSMFGKNQVHAAAPLDSVSEEEEAVKPWQWKKRKLIVSESESDVDRPTRIEASDASMVDVIEVEAPRRRDSLLGPGLLDNELKPHGRDSLLE